MLMLRAPLTILLNMIISQMTLKQSALKTFSWLTLSPHMTTPACSNAFL